MGSEMYEYKKAISRYLKGSYSFNYKYSEAGLFDRVVVFMVNRQLSSKERWLSAEHRSANDHTRECS